MPASIRTQHNFWADIWHIATPVDALAYITRLPSFPTNSSSHLWRDDPIGRGGSHLILQITPLNATSSSFDDTASCSRCGNRPYRGAKIELCRRVSCRNIPSATYLLPATAQSIMASPQLGRKLKQPLPRDPPHDDPYALPSF